MLNEEGSTRRGESWTNTAVHQILTNPIYKGERLYNQRNSRTGEIKDESEVIRIAVDPIVSPEVFQLVSEKLLSRSPKKSHPRILSSPHLLTGLLRCGECGAGMTLSTGKNNTYFYYKCTTKTKKHKDLCSSKAIAMGKLDEAVLAALADQVFAYDRVSAMLAELQKRLRGTGESITDLIKQMDAIRFKLRNIYTSIENGIEIDSMLKERLADLKGQETAVQQNR